MAGLTAAWLLAVSHLHIHYSRIGLNNIQSVWSLIVVLAVMAMVAHSIHVRREKPVDEPIDEPTEEKLIDGESPRGMNVIRAVARRSGRMPKQLSGQILMDGDTPRGMKVEWASLPVMRTFGLPPDTDKDVHATIFRAGLFEV